MMLTPRPRSRIQHLSTPILRFGTQVGGASDSWSNFLLEVGLQRSRLACAFKDLDARSGIAPQTVAFRSEAQMSPPREHANCDFMGAPERPWYDFRVDSIHEGSPLVRASLPPRDRNAISVPQLDA